MSALPLIGLCTDSKLIEPHVYQSVGDKYIHAVARGAGGLPVLVPSPEAAVDFDHLIAVLDGLVLPGSYANVHPSHYSDEKPYEGSPVDQQRDMATLKLIPRALEAGVPVLGLCRGAQEMNVALGGTLNQQVHRTEGMLDHRENPDDPLDIQYGLAHPVRLSDDGVLRRICGEDVIEVNSVHGQGIRDLAPGLRIEALAEDGLVEAFSVPDARAFAVAVQWHPEWKFAAHAPYRSLWAAFGEACRERFALRTENPEEAAWPPSRAG